MIVAYVGAIAMAFILFLGAVAFSPWFLDAPVLCGIYLAGVAGVICVAIVMPLILR